MLQYYYWLFRPWLFDELFDELLVRKYERSKIMKIQPMLLKKDSEEIPKDYFDRSFRICEDRNHIALKPYKSILWWRQMKQNNPSIPLTNALCPDISNALCRKKCPSSREFQMPFVEDKMPFFTRILFFVILVSFVFRWLRIITLLIVWSSVFFPPRVQSQTARILRRTFSRLSLEHDSSLPNYQCGFSKLLYGPFNNFCKARKCSE